MQYSKPRSAWRSSAFWPTMMVLLGLLLSGGVLFIFPAEALPDMTPIQEAVRHSSVIVHGVFSWLWCVVLGRFVWPHVHAMWQRRKLFSQWAWGFANLVILIFLAASGLLLLYGSPEMHGVLGSWHFWVGAALPLGLTAHTRQRLRA